MALDANEVTAGSKAIESLLKQRGGRGRGLHELLDSLEAGLPPAVVKKARLVASVRNKVVHDPAYAPVEKDAQAFRAAVQAVRAQLEAVPDAGAGEPARDASQASGADAPARRRSQPPGQAQDPGPAPASRTGKPARPRSRRKAARPAPRFTREQQAWGIVAGGVALAVLALWFFHA